MPFAPPPDWQRHFSAHRERLISLLGTGRVGALPDGQYFHWDKLRHRSPPEGLSPADWWAAVKAARWPLRKSVPMHDLAGNAFHFCPVEPVQEHLHRIDSRLAGRIGAAENIANSAQRDRYLFSSLIEEAITSSQLEGAATTRRVAVDMLRSGRRPRDHDERMIFNNYRAMATIREWRDRPFSPELVLDLHRQITEDTLDDPESAGRLQTPDDERVEVRDNRTRELLHRPPPAEALPERLERLCEFANRSLSGREFLHPVVHAMILHFWLAWDHPFADGNGRTARALFYWKMLQSGYWLFEFISISTILRQAPGQYKRAFLRTESDDNDLTYFLLHQLEVVGRAAEQLDAYLQRKTEEVQSVERRLRTRIPLNHRQIALLSHALRSPRAEYTFNSHKRSHNVAYATARSDLLHLAELGFLDPSAPGRKPIRFTVPADLAQRIESHEDRH
ncbi:Fic family protein [Wenzhouxiangella sp. XN79A]|uniref:Fic family protein n=1 Tax=Wenzhouxiangella sp. XN79A TaxID=2724193 RepID=UPI00144AABDD|nr:Fic family protein [Wenzhouxiangella sp. XN79A]NKI35101.1 Fic family protein [Wenzhouxiangella sp. XN79A]